VQSIKVIAANKIKKMLVFCHYKTIVCCKLCNNKRYFAGFFFITVIISNKSFAVYIIEEGIYLEITGIDFHDVYAVHIENGAKRLNKFLELSLVGF